MGAIGRFGRVEGVRGEVGAGGTGADEASAPQNKRVAEAVFELEFATR